MKNNAFEPRLKSAKNWFQLIAGLNLDFCEWLRKLLFFEQNWCAKKEKFCVSFRKIAQKFCEWKNYVGGKQFILFTEP